MCLFQWDNSASLARCFIRKQKRCQIFNPLHCITTISRLSFHRFLPWIFIFFSVSLIKRRNFMTTDNNNNKTGPAKNDQTLRWPSKTTSVTPTEQISLKLNLIFRKTPGEEIVLPKLLKPWLRSLLTADMHNKWKSSYQPPQSRQWKLFTKSFTIGAAIWHRIKVSAYFYCVAKKKV